MRPSRRSHRWTQSLGGTRSPPRTGARSSWQALPGSCRWRGRRGRSAHNGCWLGKTGLRRGETETGRGLRPAQEAGWGALLGRTQQDFPPHTLLPQSSPGHFHPSRCGIPNLRDIVNSFPPLFTDNQSVSKSWELHCQNLSRIRPLLLPSSPSWPGPPTSSFLPGVPQQPRSALAGQRDPANTSGILLLRALLWCYLRGKAQVFLVAHEALHHLHPSSLSSTPLTLPLVHSVPDTRAASWLLILPPQGLCIDYFQYLDRPLLRKQ